MENSMEKIKERLALDHQADFKHMQRKMVCLMTSLRMCSVSASVYIQNHQPSSFPHVCQMTSLKQKADISPQVHCYLEDSTLLASPSTFMFILE